MFKFLRRKMPYEEQRQKILQLIKDSDGRIVEANYHGGKEHWRIEYRYDGLHTMILKSEVLRKRTISEILKSLHESALDDFFLGY